MTTPKHFMSITLLQKTGEVPITIYSKNIHNIQQKYTNSTDRKISSQSDRVHLFKWVLTTCSGEASSQYVNRLNESIALKIERKKALLRFRLPIITDFIVLVFLYVILFMNHTVNVRPCLVAFVNFVSVFSARYVQRQKKDLSIKHIIQHSRTRQWY